MSNGQREAHRAKRVQELHRRGLVRVDLQRAVATRLSLDRVYLSDTEVFYPAWVLSLWEDHRDDVLVLEAALRSARDDAQERLLIVSTMMLEGKYEHLLPALEAVATAARRG